jgi:hypothetical protein
MRKMIRGEGRGERGAGERGAGEETEEKHT